jgi:hypothetical protein
MSLWRWGETDILAQGHGWHRKIYALTVARKYYDNRCLGGSFFFSRGGGDLASAQKFAAPIAG